MRNQVNKMSMSKKITAAITGVGEYLPDYILTNEELSRMVDTSDEWIMSHIGVKTRHILKGEGVGTSYMGARAVINLLDKTGVDPMDIDVVICATVTPDMFFPSTGNLIADQAGCKNAFAYDVSAACSGFLFALTTGAKFIEVGTSKKVIVVGADKMSSIVDYTDRSTCPIFGDGAAAGGVGAFDAFGAGLSVVVYADVAVPSVVCALPVYYPLGRRTEVGDGVQCRCRVGQRDTQLVVYHSVGNGGEGSCLVRYHRDVYGQCHRFGLFVPLCPPVASLPFEMELEEFAPLVAECRLPVPHRVIRPADGSYDGDADVHGQPRVYEVPG